MTTSQIVLASRPEGMLTSQSFRFEETTLPEVGNKEVLLSGLYYSVDPHMRGRMDDVASYAVPFQLNEPLQGVVIAKVLESKSDLFKTGDRVVGELPWLEKMVATEDVIFKINESTAPLSYYLSILGLTGLTAYFGLIHIGKPIAGETILVSGAAGAVGIVVGQIAKIKGCRVVGIAGTDEKAKLLKEKFNYDEVINYKTADDLKTAIATACPNGIDIYFDNVGGEISDAAISNINQNGRIVLCGQISQYDNAEMPVAPRLQPMLLIKSALMQGFSVLDYQKNFPRGTQQLTLWIEEGRLKFTETIIHGFEQLPAALLGLLKGDNTGKMIVEA